MNERNREALRAAYQWLEKGKRPWLESAGNGSNKLTLRPGKGVTPGRKTHPGGFVPAGSPGPTSTAL